MMNENKTVTNKNKSALDPSDFTAGKATPSRPDGGMTDLTLGTLARRPQRLREGERPGDRQRRRDGLPLVQVRVVEPPVLQLPAGTYARCNIW